MRKRSTLGVIVFSILLIYSCESRNSDTPIVLKPLKHQILSLEIIDSLVIHDTIGGLKEFLPLGISPSKEMVMIMPLRGGRKIIIGNLKNKKLQIIDLEKYVESTSNSLEYTMQDLFQIV